MILMMMNNPTMLSYIRREQPVLERLLTNYPKQITAALTATPDHPQHWLILATGSRLNAANTARLYMQKTAALQVTIAAADLYVTYEEADPSVDVVIGISLKDDDPTMQAAIEKAHTASQAHVIIVTNQKSTALTAMADATCDLLTGKESVPYITLSFQAIVLTLMLLAVRSAALQARLTDLAVNQELDEFSFLIESMNPTVQRANDFYRKFTIDFTNAPQFTAIGANVLAGTLTEMQAKFTEILRVPTHGYSLASFTHGGFMGTHENHCQFYLEINTDPAVMTQLQAVKTYESRLTPHIYTISLTGDQPTVNDNQTLQLEAVADPYKAPLLAIIPFQVLAWFIAKSRGINLNHPMYADFQAATKLK
ncbi:SIS domain-containing protein [Lactiplantibacillus plantarum]|uniref:SIS domain-containing protein n=1 Tax=Lactiplantibacillus plantarum TaxID=1590 RepID=UPI0007B54DFC|nr:SIS domain-containing protein [Lactiplantibacillus plantarum]KZU39724.1 Glucosamine--fructose-6-phosphateaminotransferase (isomerizing) [Lactiplantibacillus plantarum]